jgi:indolepyruvate decarboxylase
MDQETTVATAPLTKARDGQTAAMPQTIGEYLIERLQALGLQHIFGIPGDYVLGLYKMLESSPIQLVGTTREDAAGFAADAYARVHGLGCVCVTYCVGGLSCTNSIAGAYAEKSPVVVLSGSPGISERHRNPLLHHKVKEFDSQFEVYQKITAASAVLSDPLTAFAEIDRVLSTAVRYKRPVYLEIPRDRLDSRMVAPHQPPREPVPPSDPDALREALEESLAMLKAAKRPMILAGVEVHRFGLQDALLALAEDASLPIATTLLGKSVISEAHPLFVGVYEGGMGRDEVTRYVESADCLLLLGCFLSDIDMGIFTAHLEPDRCIHATSEDLQIRHHHFQEVRLEDFVRGLCGRGLKVKHPPIPERPSTYREPWIPSPQTPVTSSRLFSRLNKILDKRTIVIADIGDALFGSSDLTMTHRTDYISPSYYSSMGFAVPASLGASVASPESRVLVVVGDGAFQMTGTELSTVAKLGLNPIVVVMNNKGYTTERFLLDGSFNDIHNWAYHRIPELLGTGRGFEVWTEEDIDAALTAAVAHTASFSLVNVHLDPLDRSPALDRLARKLADRVRPEPSA